MDDERGKNKPRSQIKLQVTDMLINRSYAF